MGEDTITEGAAIRSQLPHPVVDADGHLVESIPVLADLVRQIAGAEVADRFLGGTPSYRSRRAPILHALDVAGTQGRRAIAPWWALPTDPTDRATASVPALLHERLDELGIDFAILYPSVGLTVIGADDPEVRVAACRACNLYAAALTADLGDRLAAVATIPCHTPEEAISELEHAVGACGFKAVMVNSYVRRAPGQGADHEWYDLLAMDSTYDYGPLWARCAELGVAVTVHTPTMGLPLRSSPSCYMLNHIGNFAAGSEAFAKALVFGGVMAAVPRLQVAFLEGGVSWGVQLHGDLLSRWEKRGGSAIHRLDPSLVDFSAWDALMARYGGPTFADPVVRRATFGQSDNPPPVLDDFAASGVSTSEDLEILFDRFFFGCEADDPMVAWAYAAQGGPGSAAPRSRPALRAMLGSDLGHWDVADMRTVVPEAHELVTQGALSHAQFRAFACDNVILLHGRANPSFFDGTVVARYAAATLDADRRRSTATLTSGAATSATGSSS